MAHCGILYTLHVYIPCAETRWIRCGATSESYEFAHLHAHSRLVRIGRSVKQENQSRERQSTIEHAAVNTAEMETRVDGRTTAMAMTETAVASTADDDERRRGSIAVTWSRCKKLLLDLHFNSDRIFYW